MADHANVGKPAVHATHTACDPANHSIRRPVPGPVRVDKAMLFPTQVPTVVVMGIRSPATASEGVVTVPPVIGQS